MAVRKPQGNPLLALSLMGIGSTQLVVPDLSLYLASWPSKVKDASESINFAIFSGFKAAYDNNIFC